MFPWFSYGVFLLSHGFSQGFPIISSFFPWFSHGFPRILVFLYGFPMVFLGFPRSEMAFPRHRGEVHSTLRLHFDQRLHLDSGAESGRESFQQGFNILEKPQENHRKTMGNMMISLFQTPGKPMGKWENHGKTTVNHRKMKVYPLVMTNSLLWKIHHD